MKLELASQRSAATRPQIIFAIFLIALSIHLVTSIVRLMITLAKRPGTDDSMALVIASNPPPGSATAPASADPVPRQNFTMNPPAAPAPPVIAVPLPPPIFAERPAAPQPAPARPEESERPTGGSGGGAIGLRRGTVTVNTAIPLIYFDPTAITIVQEPLDDGATNQARTTNSLSVRTWRNP